MYLDILHKEATFTCTSLKMKNVPSRWIMSAIIFLLLLLQLISKQFALEVKIFEILSVFKASKKKCDVSFAPKSGNVSSLLNEAYSLGCSLLFNSAGTDHSTNNT